MSPPPQVRERVKNSTSARRVQAIVGLRLLEMIQGQDLPGEMLEAEDPAQTLPRRLGLSAVVDRQMRTYQGDVKKGLRLTDAEVMALFRLVIRRPDSDEVFFGAGRLLASSSGRGRWTRILSRRGQYAMARTRVARRLKKLFGRRVGGFGPGAFTVEGRALLFIESDPGGEACHFLSGFCQEILQQSGGGVAEVNHTLCQARGDDLCRWEGVYAEKPAEDVRGQVEESGTPATP